MSRSWWDSWARDMRSWISILIYWLILPFRQNLWYKFPIMLSRRRMSTSLNWKKDEKTMNGWKKCQVLNEVGLVWELFHVKQSTSSLMKQATATGARREDAFAKLVERLSSSSILILNNNTLHLQKIADNKEDSKWKKIAATTEAKVNLPKICCQQHSSEEGRGEKSFVMRTRVRREEIITTLQEKPFTQGFRRAAGLATCSGLCDPERPEKHSLTTDSSFFFGKRKEMRARLSLFCSTSPSSKAKSLVFFFLYDELCWESDGVIKWRNTTPNSRQMWLSHDFKCMWVIVNEFWQFANSSASIVSHFIQKSACWTHAVWHILPGNVRG